MQSETQGADMKTFEDVLAVCRKVYEDYDASKINNVFLSLQKQIFCAMEVEGGNNYKEPHQKKMKCRRNGEHIERIVVNKDLYVMSKSKIGNHDLNWSLYVPSGLLVGL